jgi:hypothetical protein
MSAGAANEGGMAAGLLIPFYILKPGGGLRQIGAAFVQGFIHELTRGRHGMR